MPDASRRRLAIGQSIPCPAGRYTVTVNRQETVVRVEVTAGRKLVDQLSRSFQPAHETLACSISRVIVRALRRDGATVETARRSVVDFIDGQLAFLLDDPSPAATAAADQLITIKHWYEPIEVHTWRDNLAADIRAHLTVNAAA